jgi:hypothetical protein
MQQSKHNHNCVHKDLARRRRLLAAGLADTAAKHMQETHVQAVCFVLSAEQLPVRGMSQLLVISSPHLGRFCGELFAHRNHTWRFMQRHQLAMEATQVIDNALPKSLRWVGALVQISSV